MSVLSQAIPLFQPAPAPEIPERRDRSAHHDPSRPPYSNVRNNAAYELSKFRI